MKHIVGVSLGSSSRDHKSEVSLLGEDFIIERRGLDGDLTAAKKLLKELDGTVDAIGLGGLDVYLYSRKGRYSLKEGVAMLECLQKTPAADGSGLKNYLEPIMIQKIAQDGRFPLKGKHVLMVCAMDRLGMAEAFVKEGADPIFGDLIFSLDKDTPITSLDELGDYADRLIPELAKLPLGFLYPMGKKQTAPPENKYPKYYDWADYIAGDFHFIRKYLPPQLNGKVIITNTVTSKDIEDLKARGASYLITTTPEFTGRSFGTNVVEALILAILGKRWEEVTKEDYLTMIERLDMKPRIVALN